MKFIRVECTTSLHSDTILNSMCLIQNWCDRFVLATSEVDWLLHTMKCVNVCWREGDFWMKTSTLMWICKVTAAFNSKFLHSHILRLRMNTPSKIPSLIYPQFPVGKVLLGFTVEWKPKTKASWHNNLLICKEHSVWGGTDTTWPHSQSIKPICLFLG